MADAPLDLPQGTLDLLILKTLDAGAAARVGDLRAAAPDLQRHARHPAGLALSGAASPRAPRLDQGAVGDVGQQPPREVLRAHQERADAARRRDLGVARAERRRRASDRQRLGRRAMLTDLRLRLRSLFRADVSKRSSTRRSGFISSSWSESYVAPGHGARRGDPPGTTGSSAASIRSRKRTATRAASRSSIICSATCGTRCDRSGARPGLPRSPCSVSASASASTRPSSA